MQALLIDLILFLGGMFLWCILFRSSFLRRVPMMFYRGIKIGFVVAVAQALVLWLLFITSHFAPCNGAAVVVMTFSFIVAFLVVLPVTIDRSVSVFILGRMRKLERPVSEDEINNILKDEYVSALNAGKRRMDEQVLTGNVERINGGYRLTPRGQKFISFASHLSRILKFPASFE